MNPLSGGGGIAVQLASLPLDDRLFFALALTIAALVVLAVAFVAAMFWLRLRNVVKERQWQDRERRWTDLTLRFLTGDARGEAIAGQVRSDERLPFLEFLLRYASRIRGPERDRLGDLADPFLPDLLSRLEDRSLYRRARAIQILGVFGLPEHRESVIRALDDEAPFVAMVAARALATHGDPEDHPLIVARLARFENWSTGYLTTLLATMGSTLLPPLRELLADRARPLRVRTVAAAALEAVHDLEAADAAARLLGVEIDPDLLTALLRLLAKVGRPEHLPTVRPFLSSEHDPVRGAAYGGLGVLGGPEDARRLRTGIDDPSPWVALKAAQGLRRLGSHHDLADLAGSDHPRAVLAGQVLEEAV